MPRVPLPPEVDAFLRRPNQAVLALLRPGGAPHTLATWYDWDGRELLVNTETGKDRIGWAREDGRVALTAIDPASFYRHVSVIGRIERITDDPDLADIDRLARRYTGGEYPRRSRPRTSLWVRLERWHGWDRAPSEAASPERPRLPV